MLKLLSEAGRSFLRAFAGSLLILLPGVLAAPDLNVTLGLATAALVASVAAGLKAIQVFVPQLSFTSLLPDNVKKWGSIVDSFARAFLATLVTLSIGILTAPNLNFGKAAVVALLVAAVTAGIRAVQGALTPGDFPAPQSGIAGQEVAS